MLVINIYGFICSHQSFLPRFLLQITPVFTILWRLSCFYAYKDISWYRITPIFVQIVRKHALVHLRHCRQPRLSKTYNSAACTSKQELKLAVFLCFQLSKRLYIQTMVFTTILCMSPENWLLATTYYNVFVQFLAWFKCMRYVYTTLCWSAYVTIS